MSAFLFILIKYFRQLIEFELFTLDLLDKAGVISESLAQYIDIIRLG
jgi:hypothetical protein